ncbi:NADH dehydrogenase (ubiquinone) complex I, assembly factor 6 homolog [Phlebotomus argentipes]|uniref:NADH dehydrogenase (ubiquinone) complex I, assembly factor 6 homolog n=1 Tax=Phlebotomus argentipes TaxID=94469 RepID=UPI0028931F9B|nr:NADH dehydrogenase (ubiquinone) complex I, assembly factor 6 homolog [Phlebotomus argentipes]
MNYRAWRSCKLIHILSLHSPARNLSSVSGSVSSYCLNSVKNHDYENFLALLLLDNSLMQKAFCIRAFNVEVARVNDQVSEAKIGEMRLKFWEDTIDKIFSPEDVPIPEHPIAKALKNTTMECKLSKMYFQRLVKSRRRLGNVSFLTVKEMEDYAEQTNSSIYYLILEAAGVKNLHADHAASHLGKAQGISNIIRSLPHQRRNAIIPIPQETLLKHGVSQERIYRDQESDKGVENCVFEIATVAHQHLEKARSMKDQIPRDCLPILLPGIAIDRYLERLRRAHFHPSVEMLRKRDNLLPISLKWNRMRSKF